MKTLRWSVPVVVALAAGGMWLWSQTRAELSPPSHEPASTSPTRVVEPPSLTRSLSSSSHLSATPATDAFTDVGTQLKQRFAGERVDASWAATTRQQLDTDLGRFASKDAGVRTIECRASLCRVELGIASHDAGSAFIDTWGRERAFEGPVYGSQTADDTIVMYLGKPGTDLASL